MRGLLKYCYGMLLAWLSMPGHATEPALQAALTYRLVQFSEWPAPHPRLYCVAKDQDVHRQLQLLLTDQQIRMIDQPAQANGCHVLFLGSALPADLAWQQVLQQPELLSIAATPELFALGCIFGLIREPQQVAFRVNLTLARSRQYQLNARMLRLAKEFY